MTVTNWYATQLLIDERMQEIERTARLAANRRLGRRAARIRRATRHH